MVDPKVFRAYDIRALVPDLVDESSIYFGKVGAADAYQAPLEPDGVEEIGKGLARLFGGPASEPVGIGFDARLSSPAWCAALSKGLQSQGLNVVDLGMTTTDMVYYYSGKYNAPGVMITASHCTKELNGMKIARAGAHVIGQGAGMEELRDHVMSGGFADAATPGKLTKKDVLSEYTDHLMTFIDPKAIKPFRIIADAGNGVGGLPAHALVERLPQIQMEEMFFNPDGTFPNHEANPFELENIEELIHRTPTEGFDFAVAWDGDADRVFFLDEKGNFLPGDFVTTLVARYFLDKHPGAAIVYDIRASWAVRDWVTRLGGRAIADRVGHAFIKRTMRKEDAVFGGEVSGHYYFRDHFYADNGYIPFIAMLQMLSSQNVKMSELVASLGDYYLSGEINSTVADTQAVLEAIAAKYSDADINYLDGITVSYPDWHFNVRPSANDPVVRLNLEAKSQADMERRRDEVLGLIRE